MDIQISTAAINSENIAHKGIRSNNINTVSLINRNSHSTSLLRGWERELLTSKVLIEVIHEIQLASLIRNFLNRVGC